MGALDERNLKRAVNRYGTLPKGARIGAYLQSLRDADQPEGGQVDQDEMGATSGGNSGSCNDVAASAAEHASLRQLVVAKAATPQQPMLRYQEIDLTFCAVTFRENFRFGGVSYSLSFSFQIKLQPWWFRTSKPLPSQNQSSTRPRPQAAPVTLGHRWPWKHGFPSRRTSPGIGVSSTSSPTPFGPG